MLYCMAAASRLEPLGDAWVAYSALSGDTLQLNAEAAAVLELLAEGPMDDLAVCRALAVDTQTDPVAVEEAIRHVWDQLVLAGLVRVAVPSAHNEG